MSDDMDDVRGRGPGSGYVGTPYRRKAGEVYYSTYPESQIDHARVAEQGVLLRHRVYLTASVAPPPKIAQSKSALLAMQAAERAAATAAAEDVASARPDDAIGEIEDDWDDEDDDDDDGEVEKSDDEENSIGSGPNKNGDPLKSNNSGVASSINSAGDGGDGDNGGNGDDCDTICEDDAEHLDGRGPTAIAPSEDSAEEGDTSHYGVGRSQKGGSKAEDQGGIDASDLIAAASTDDEEQEGGREVDKEAEDEYRVKEDVKRVEEEMNGGLQNVEQEGEEVMEKLLAGAQEASGATRSARETTRRRENQM